MRKSTSFIITIIGIIVVLSVVQVVVSTSLSTAGVELGKLQEQYKNYSKQNNILREKLLIATSYTQIISKASVMGFTEEKSRLFLSTSLPLAVKP